MVRHATPLSEGYSIKFYRQSKGKIKVNLAEVDLQILAIKYPRARSRSRKASISLVQAEDLRARQTKSITYIKTQKSAPGKQLGSGPLRAAGRRDSPLPLAVADLHRAGYGPARIVPVDMP